MTPERRAECITTALVHQLHRFHGYRLTLDCNTCLDRRSRPIRAEDILSVEIVDETPSAAR